MKTTKHDLKEIVTGVHGDGLYGRYWFECSCGTSGSTCKKRSTARLEWRQHAETATQKEIEYHTKILNGALAALDNKEIKELIATLQESLEEDDIPAAFGTHQVVDIG